MAGTEFEEALTQLGLRRDQIDEIMYDADDALADAIRNDWRGRIVPPGPETMHRVRDPLSAEVARNFGNIALEALQRFDGEFREKDDRRL